MRQATAMEVVNYEREASHLSNSMRLKIGREYAHSPVVTN
ncbi:protein of unknown function [Pararobbsia alpina]